MPYSDKDKLPDNIKNNLPSQAQDIWMNAFNSAYSKNNGDEEASNKIAWGAVKNAGYNKNDQGKWIKKETEKFTIKDKEIFAVGTWKGDTYTDEDLEEIVKNYFTLRDEIKPMLHIGHDRALENDSQPSLGWISDLKKKGEKLLATFSDMPKIVYEAIDKGLYKRVSSEIYWGIRHAKTNKKYGKVLGGVALVGAAIPAVRTLQDLSVFTLDMDQCKTYDFNIEQGEIKIDKNGGDIMPDDNDKMKKYIDDLNDANKRADEALKKAKEYKDELVRRKAEQLENDKKRYTEDIKKYCEDNVKAGKLSPAARDEILKDIDKKTYTEESKLSFTFEQIQSILEKQYTIDMNEKTYHTENDKNDNIEDKMDSMVKKYMKDHKVSYTEAIKDLIDNDKSFAKMYTEMKYSDE